MSDRLLIFIVYLRLMNHNRRLIVVVVVYERITGTIDAVDGTQLRKTVCVIIILLHLHIHVVMEVYVASSVLQETVVDLGLLCGLRTAGEIIFESCEEGGALIALKASSS